MAVWPVGVRTGRGTVSIAGSAIARFFDGIPTQWKVGILLGALIVVACPAAYYCRGRERWDAASIQKARLRDRIKAANARIGQLRSDVERLQSSTFYDTWAPAHGMVRQSSAMMLTDRGLERVQLAEAPSAQPDR